MLFVPDFYYILTSVSKLSRDLCCTMVFRHDEVSFQAQLDGKILGICKQERGLYLFASSYQVCGSHGRFVGATTKDFSDDDGLLWHKRLRHASYTQLSYVPGFKPSKQLQCSIKDCVVCHLTKLSR